MSEEGISKVLEFVNAIQETFKRDEKRKKFLIFKLNFDKLSLALLKTKKATLELSAIIALLTISSTRTSIVKPAIKLVKNARALLMLTAKSAPKVKGR